MKTIKKIALRGSLNLESIKSRELLVKLIDEAALLEDLIIDDQDPNTQQVVIVLTPAVMTTNDKNEEIIQRMGHIKLQDSST